jgi:hypothetical protein
MILSNCPKADAGPDGPLQCGKRAWQSLKPWTASAAKIKEAPRRLEGRCSHPKCNSLSSTNLVVSLEGLLHLCAMELGERLAHRGAQY